MRSKLPSGAGLMRRRSRSSGAERNDYTKKIIMLHTSNSYIIIGFAVLQPDKVHPALELPVVDEGN